MEEVFSMEQVDEIYSHQRVPSSWPGQGAK